MKRKVWSKKWQLYSIKSPIREFSQEGVNGMQKSGKSILNYAIIITMEVKDYCMEEAYRLQLPGYICNCDFETFAFHEVVVVVSFAPLMLLLLMMMLLLLVPSKRSLFELLSFSSLLLLIQLYAKPVLVPLQKSLCQNMSSACFSLRYYYYFCCKSCDYFLSVVSVVAVAFDLYGRYELYELEHH